MGSVIWEELTDKDHLGHLFILSMKKRPDAVCQIDAVTGESETSASVLSRSIAVARCFRRLGYQVGDVMSLSGPNNINLHIPYYAALMNGLPIAGVDPTFKYDELEQALRVTRPRISFCMKAAYDDHIRAIQKLQLDTRVVTLDDGEHSMADFVEIYDPKDINDADFEPAAFDPEKTFAWLVSTSGTTGIFKSAAITHKSIMDFIRIYFDRNIVNMRRNKKILTLSPVQWITGFSNAIYIPATESIKLQTSSPSMEHIIDIINEYKPNRVLTSYSTIRDILKHEKKCDLSCFDAIMLTGAKIHKDLIMDLKSRMRKDALCVEVYGQTESLGPVIQPNFNGPLGSCGKASEISLVKLVDPETGKEITEPNIPGEMWTKGLSFTEYYNNPEETAKAFTEDGWYKTGDLLYRDQDDNYYYVERIKMLIKYRSYHVTPVELEELIRTHPSVLDVGVTSVPNELDGEHPVAVVVRKPGTSITAQEIKDLVASKVSNSKLLRGGVVFVDELPLTSTGKVARMKLRQIAFNSNRE
ncbi:luciferin 4-monooxygenase-like [Galleria mellonella]|uniref:Luciferin 4-monooxygenase-like n=1 Tax=Galleria mellonella TaxID=7137 RepID=A0ABM3MKW2_GALME|nr:luciferin 4-monooxygenase-like [Galleria mellonella]